MDRETAIRAAAYLVAAASPHDPASWEDGVIVDLLKEIDPDRSSYMIDKMVRSVTRGTEAHRVWATDEHLQKLPGLVPVIVKYIMRWPDTSNRSSALYLCGAELRKRTSLSDWMVETDLSNAFIFNHEQAQPETPGGPQVCFSGYGDDRRFQLERSARAIGLAVVPAVTVRLAYLCCGPNAGPSKISKALKQGARLVRSEDELAVLLERGVLE